MSKPKKYRDLTSDQKKKRDATNRRWAEKNPEKARAGSARRTALYRKKHGKKHGYRKYSELSLDEKKKHSELVKQWRAKNPTKAKSIELKKTYGITYSDYLRILQSQGGGCAICGKAETVKAGYLSVDHCHNSSEVRGLLCMKCNTGLGGFRDDPDIIRRALAYLEKKVP